MIARFVFVLLALTYLFPNGTDWEWVAWFHDQPGQWKAWYFLGLAAVVAIEGILDRTVKVRVKK